MESGRVEIRKYLRKFENVGIFKNFEILVNFRRFLRVIIDKIIRDGIL